MKKVRVFYKPNGCIALMMFMFNAKKEGQTDEEFMEYYGSRSILAKYPYDDTTLDKLPDLKHKDKWRGEKGKGIWIDESIITPKEARKAKEDALDAELAKPNSDPVTVIRLNRDLEKMK